MDYGHTKAKSQILFDPNSNPTPWVGYKSSFRLLYSSTSTMQGLEISKMQNLEISTMQNLEISTMQNLEISRSYIVEVDQ